MQNSEWWTVGVHNPETGRIAVICTCATAAEARDCAHEMGGTVFFRRPPAPPRDDFEF